LLQQIFGVLMLEIAINPSIDSDDAHLKSIRNNARRISIGNL
jgi:hypothetical protein